MSFSDQTATAEMKKFLNQFESADKSMSPSKYRSQAYQQLLKTKFPSRQDEEWRYTDLQQVFQTQFNTEKSSELNFEDVKKYFWPYPNINTFVFINGIFKVELSHIENKEEGLVIESLQDIEKKNPELLQKHLGQNGSYVNNAFTLLNTSYFQDGIFISVRENIQLKNPIHLIYLSDNNNSGIHQTRNIIHLEKNSQAEVIASHYTHSPHRPFVNEVTEIKVESGATLHSYQIQDLGEDSSQINNTFIEQHRDSNFFSNTISLNGGLIRNNFNLLFREEGANATLNGVAVLNQKQHVDTCSFIDHAVPNCYSSQLFKGILDDQSENIFTGKILVRENAQKTKAFQTNKNMLLSDLAVANQKPQLEIYADDVQCSHGATTGHLDNEALMYMRSRGIGKKKAEKLLLHAFAKDILKDMHRCPIRKHICTLILDKLNKI